MRDGGPDAVRDLQDRWDTLPVEALRGALRTLISRIDVTPGRPLGQVQIVPTWIGD